MGDPLTTQTTKTISLKILYVYSKCILCISHCCKQYYCNMSIQWIIHDQLYINLYLLSLSKISNVICEGLPTETFLGSEVGSIEREKFSTPSTTLSSIIATLNTAWVSPARNVTLNGPELMSSPLHIEWTQLVLLLVLTLASLPVAVVSTCTVMSNNNGLLRTNTGCTFPVPSVALYTDSLKNIKNIRARSKEVTTSSYYNIYKPGAANIISCIIIIHSIMIQY